MRSTSKWEKERPCPTLLATMCRGAVPMVGKYRDFTCGEEVDLFLRLAEHGRLVNLPEVLLLYRTHESNYTNSAFAREQRYRDAWTMVRDACQRRNLTMEVPPMPATTELDELPVDRDEVYLWWALAVRPRHHVRKYAWRSLTKAPLSLH